MLFLCIITVPVGIGNATTKGDCHGETSRVKRLRDAKRQQGLKAVTIWLTTEEELRLKDLALQWHCSPSAVVQQALARSRHRRRFVSVLQQTSHRYVSLSGQSFWPCKQRRPLLQRPLQGRTETLARDLPGLVRQLVEGLALEALGVSVTDTFGDVTDREALDVPVTDTDYGTVTDRERPDEEVEAPDHPDSQTTGGDAPAHHDAARRAP